MGGFALPIFVATTMMETKSKIAAGKAKDKAYQMEAKQVEMQGQAQSNERLRALNDALSTQQAMFGAQGRVGSNGSAQAIQQGDTNKALSDIEMIKAGVSSSSSSLKSAGTTARRQANTDAAMSTAESLYKYSQLGK